MTYTKNLGLTAIIGAFAFGAVACGDDDDPTPTTGAGGSTTTTTTTSGMGGETASNTIADIAAGNDDLQTLVAAATEAGLLDTLADPDVELTVFAPTDAAFEQALTDLGLTADQLLGNQALLTAILRYHIVAGEVPSSAITGPGFAQTDGGYTLFYNATDTVELNGGADTTTDGGADVTTPDIDADNGIVHIIDRVLLPPDILDLARYAIESNNAQLGELATALDAENLTGLFDVDLLTDDLSTVTEYTVFAPTDEAFPDTPPAQPALSTILTYHVVTGAVDSGSIPAVTGPSAAEASFTDGGTTRSYNLSLLFDTSNGVKINGGSGDGATELGADVAVADLRAVNGYVHVIDGTLLPLNVAQVALAGGFSTLVDAVTASAPIPSALTGLPNDVSVLDALSQPTLAPLSVFAPTNDAFVTAFPGGLPTGNGADATILGVLGLHVIPGALPVRAQDLPGDTATTVSPLAGSDLSFDTAATPPSVTVTNGGTTAGIVITDVGATNGIVHVIDGVLLEGT